MESLEEPNDLCNMMQICPFLVSWLCGGLKRKIENAFPACLLVEREESEAEVQAARETQSSPGHSDSERG